MTIRTILKFVFLIIIVFLSYWFIWDEKEIINPPGILVQEQPYQKNITDGKYWEKEDYKITPLAEFHIKACVLSTESYYIDRESDISPVDLALGWGPMSDQSVIDRIDISQRNRWYHWSTDNYPIPRRQIEANSANMHMIPANDEIEDRLNQVIKGNLIELGGYLVFIEARDGWKWKSSLSRNDTGGGACEVIWVENFKILDVNQ